MPRMLDEQTVGSHQVLHSPLPPMILMIAPELDLRTQLSSTFHEVGYVVLAVTDGALALDLVRDNRVTLLLLDSAVFKTCGFTLYQQLRACPQADGVPVLVLLERESEIALLESHDVCADDYLIKPFSLAELHACIRTLLRYQGSKYRRHASAFHRLVQRAVTEEGQIVVGDLSIDLAQRSVRRGNRSLEIASPLLFDLLVYFVRHPGIVLTREQLLCRVWGVNTSRYETSDTRTVSVHIHWLRSLLGDDVRGEHLIQTIRGVGYRYNG